MPETSYSLIVSNAAHSNASSEGANDYAPFKKDCLLDRPVVWSYCCTAHKDSLTKEISHLLHLNYLQLAQPEKVIFELFALASRELLSTVMYSKHTCQFKSAVDCVGIQPIEKVQVADQRSYTLSPWIRIVGVDGKPILMTQEQAGLQRELWRIHQGQIQLWLHSLDLENDLKWQMLLNDLHEKLKLWTDTHKKHETHIRVKPYERIFVGFYDVRRETPAYTGVIAPQFLGQLVLSSKLHPVQWYEHLRAWSKTIQPYDDTSYDDLVSRIDWSLEELAVLEAGP